METTRRTFLGGLAAASIPAGATVAAVPEAQDQKCTRLLLELLAECRKLSLPICTRFGAGIDLPVGGEGDYMHYGCNEEGDRLLTVYLKNSEGA